MEIRKLRVFLNGLMIISGLVLISLKIDAQAKASAVKTGTNPFIAGNDVTWNSLGKDENESMPIGNGDIAANVWTEQNGDLVLLVSKSDAWTEQGKLVKIGRVRIKMMPNPFVGAAGFMQVLKLETGVIEIKNGTNIVQVWVDANHPVLHVQAHFERPATLQAALEFWRPTMPLNEQWPDKDYSKVMTGDAAPRKEPDIIFPAVANRISWCHFNPDSYYPYLLRQEHLESLLTKFTDPLLHRCFGAVLTGPGLVSSNDSTLKSAVPAKDLQLDLIALTQQKAGSPKSWRKSLDKLIDRIVNINPRKARLEHEKWWQDRWSRSWIHIDGVDDAPKVSQGYLMQRYMVTSSSRGEMPPKFNGGLFTVGHNLPDTAKQGHANHDPDYRDWGDSYWNQNNRLLYWPLIASGDTDLLKPWFDMYMKALPLARGRTQIYYKHEGAHFPETMNFWGLPRLEDFGKDNPTNEIKSHWQRYHVQGSLEVIMQMLDVYDYGRIKGFASTTLIPFADETITFYDQHWTRDGKGKILMSPMQSLETYQLDAVNPTPDIAGLMAVLPRLLSLPEELTTEKQRTAWARLLKNLPAIPVGTTAKGKVPPLGVGDLDGKPIILPAEKYGKPSNSENPELYVAYPYRLYGVGKPDLELALNTFAARIYPQNTCWGQDGPQAAVLGLTEVAKKAVASEFGNYGDQRFQWFWKPAHDWIPDLDNGGTGMITLQLMLMQCDDRRIQLLPSWPKEWTADFKLHAPYQTTVEGHVENGKISNLKVTPKSRAKDILIVK
ncbi:MAG: hypothetical protein JWP81_4024 [Ferruginibacter sp.]|nr:hypothetical protein [Ferruginibacter sp.]